MCLFVCLSVICYRHYGKLINGFSRNFQDKLHMVYVQKYMKYLGDVAFDMTLRLPRATVESP